jgi:hypothetical protein
LDEPIVAPRDAGARVRLLAHLDKVNAWQTADEIVGGAGLKLKTVQNLIAGMVKEVPQPFATQGTGAKNDPRRYHTLAQQFDGFAADIDEEMVPPDDAYKGEDGGGNHFGGSPDKAGNDRWTG